MLVKNYFGFSMKTVLFIVKEINEFIKNARYLILVLSHANEKRVVYGVCNVFSTF